MQRNFLLIVVAGLSFLFSCSPKYNKSPNKYITERGGLPDYSDERYWAAHPWKYDPSDSVPGPLKGNYIYDSTVDVFFLHPTSFTTKQNTAWNADINDVGLNTKTDYTSILYQASAFNEYRLFAPRYRQAHLRSYYSATNAATAAFDTAYHDIKNAFQYYLTTYNRGRPIIIASHSQGTTHALRLLKEFFDSTFLAPKLVAAYVIGMYIPDDYFVSLSPCKDSLQVGCLCGWRSFQNGYVPEFVRKEKKNAWVVNPLSWDTTSNYVSKKQNKGAVLRNFNKVYTELADAQIKGPVIWINKPVFPGSFFIRMKNYHIADINFFYLNIRGNLRQRVQTFKNKTP
jgi:hypothetical protein